MDPNFFEVTDNSQNLIKARDNFPREKKKKHIKLYIEISKIQSIPEAPTHSKM